jgi:hypothetical protein
LSGFLIDNFKDMRKIRIKFTSIENHDNQYGYKETTGSEASTTHFSKYQLI